VSKEELQRMIMNDLGRKWSYTHVSCVCVFVQRLHRCSKAYGIFSTIM